MKIAKGWKDNQRIVSCAGPTSVVFPRHLLLVTAAHRLQGEMHL